MRVFADRLICPEDHAVVSQQLTTKIAEFFGDVEGIEGVSKEPLIYGDFRELPLLLDNYEAVKMGVDPENKCFRMYEELIEGDPIQRDADPVASAADQAGTAVDSAEGQGEENEEEDLNEDGTVNLNSMATSVVDTAPKKEVSTEDDPYRLVRQLGQMGLEAYNRFMRPPLVGIVLFDDALSHLVKLHRMLRTPRGSMLLVGYGGSGRRSLTKLAAFMCGYGIFEITLSRA